MISKILIDVVEKVYARRQVVDPVKREEYAREIVAMYYSGGTDPNELFELIGG